MNNAQIINKRQSYQEHLVGISILLAFLLPHSSTLLLLVNPLLCLLLVFHFGERRMWRPYVLVVLVPIFISILLNFQAASLKALQSTLTILLYFACFPLIGKVQVRNGYLYICLAYILISQLVYLLGVPGLESFFERVYPISEEDLAHFEYMSDNITAEAVFDYRLGGLYHNSNQCSKYLTMLLAFFLSVNYSKHSKNVIYFVLIAYSGILLTGSRTGFVVGSLIAYFGLLRNKEIAGWVRSLAFGIALLGIIYILIKGSALRGLDIGGGLEGSANMKWETFCYYLQSENNPLALLFGHLDISLFNGGIGDVMGGFDSEYGSLTFRFGFVGLIGILLFYWNVAKRIPKSQWFYFFILLWIVSSTIVASYRAFFVFMLLTSIVYANNKKKKYQELSRKSTGYPIHKLTEDRA